MKDIKELDARAEGHVENYLAPDFTGGHFNRSEIADIFKAGASYGEAKGWIQAIDYLMDTAGNYCNCKNAYGEQCDKHAQTYAYHYLKDEGKRRGIL